MRSLYILLALTLAAGCGGDESKSKTNVGTLDQTDDTTGDKQDTDGDGIPDEDEVVAPEAPTGLAATPAVQGATLTWNAAETATKYILLRSTTAGAGYAQVYAGANKTYFDGALTPGTTYYYVVQAENEAGKSPNSSEASASPLYPLAAAPATVAVVQADAQLRVYWSAAAGGVNYFLQRQTEGGAYVNVATGATLTSYVDTGVVNGYRYGYRIQVANADGALTPSTTATESPYHPGRQFCVPSQDGVHFFDAQAEFAAAPARTIGAARMFTNPTDMAVDTLRNRVYVLDTLASSVAIYDTNFPVHPVTSPVLATLTVPVGSSAVTLSTSAGELYVAGGGSLTVYDITTLPPTWVRSTIHADLAAVGGVAVGAGEIFTVRMNGINRWNATSLASIGVISPTFEYMVTVPLSIEYVSTTDQLFVLDTGGRIRVYNRNTTGSQAVVKTRATHADASDLAFDSVSNQVLVMRRDEATFSNVYFYDVTTANSIPEMRRFKVFESATFTSIEVDSQNGRFYVMNQNNRVLLYTNLHTIVGTSLGNASSANNYIVSSVNGMTNPQMIGLDSTNQEIYVRNSNGFVTVHSLNEGASNNMTRYTWLTGYGFTGDVAIYPAINRFYGEEPNHISWFTPPMPTVVTSSSVVFESYTGYYNNLSLNETDNRLYSFDAKPDTWSELHIRGLDADGDIRYNMAIYDMAPTTSTGTNVAYGAFPGGGEVIAIDPEANFGWVFTPSLTVKRTFTLDAPASTWVSLVADATNQEIFVLRDGVVEVYNRNALKGNLVSPARTATLVATASMAASKDIEMCK